MSISREDVEGVARLAHLELSPAETARMADTLGAILDYMAVLAAADTVEDDLPLSEETTPLRDDEPRTGLCAEEAVAGAPQAVGNLFKVPPMLSGGDRP